MAVTAGTTSTTLSQNVATYYEKKLLSRLNPMLHFYKFGKAPSFVIPSRMGKTIVWTKYSNFAASDVQDITEGTTPSKSPLSSSNVSATVAQYLIFDLISDFVDLIAIDPIIEEKADGVFADAMALKVDTLIRNVLSGGTEQIAAGVAAISSLATSDTLKTSEIRDAVRRLERANVRPHRLTPGFYPFFCHPDCKYDLMGDTAAGSFVDVRKYVESGQKDIEMNKLGDAYGAKGFVTSNIATVSSVVQTYNNLMFGDEAFGVVDISGTKKNQGGFEIIVHQPGSAGSLDPGNQQGSIAAKATFVAKLLDSTRVIVMKTRATKIS